MAQKINNGAEVLDLLLAHVAYLRRSMQRASDALYRDPMEVNDYLNRSLKRLSDLENCLREDLDPMLERRDRRVKAQDIENRVRSVEQTLAELTDLLPLLREEKEDS